MSSKASPRYLQLAQQLSEEITAGKYEAGDDIPTEAQLCTTHSVSRFTVREALRRLEEDGLIERQQGRGSRVIASTPRQPFVLSGPRSSDVLRYVADTTLELRALDAKVVRTRVRNLRLPEPDDWVGFSGLRKSIRTGEPIGVFSAYLHREVALPLEEISGGDSPIYTRVMARHGINLDYVDETISAEGLSKLAARRLRSEAGSPALRIERHFVAEKFGLFEATVSIHPAHAFQYSLRLSRSAARSATPGNGARSVP